MPIIYDRLYDRLKYIPADALANGGHYIDVLNGQEGFIPQWALTKERYLDPVTGRLEYKPVLITTTTAPPPP
jgi:hypothetical protein